LADPCIRHEFAHDFSVDGVGICRHGKVPVAYAGIRQKIMKICYFLALWFDMKRYLAGNLSEVAGILRPAVP
ncbi:hypothetical protein OFN94_42785, partial [Escherichia coli]|nr:hypothetical protein [Escherichia coli]